MIPTMITETLKTGAKPEKKEPSKPISEGMDSPATRMLFAMQNTMGHIYAGTVDPAVVKKRRAKNKVARRSRAINRKR